jgi:hypothetical protein
MHRKMSVLQDRRKKRKSEKIAEFQNLQITGISPLPDVDPIMFNPNKVYRIQKWVNKGTLTTNAATETGYGFSFSLNDLDEVSSFTTIFDQWKIDEVLIQFEPRLSQFNTVSSSIGRLLTVLDYDDAITPTGSAYMRPYSTLLDTPCYDRQVRVVQPRFAVAAYSGAFTSFANTNGWVDSASPGVLYYGVKALTTVASVGFAVYDVVCKYTLSFRQNR